MKNLLTYKLKITSVHPQFMQIANSYIMSANWMSNIIFSSKKIDTPNHLSREFYGVIREKFKLPSQLTCSLFRHIVSTYRSMKSQNKWELAKFKKLSIPLCWKRDFNVRKKGISIWGEIIQYKSRSLPKGKWIDSKLKLINKKWYLHLVIKTKETLPKAQGTIIGVDRGQKNILCAYEPKTNKTLFIKGKQLNHKRQCIRQTRAKVASVGTRSAKRLLKRLSGREKSVTQEILHIASKQLVNFAQNVNANTIVLENLIGIKNNKKIHHKQIARNNRWPYALLELFITYKASAVGVKVEHVNAKYTSQGCPKCGHVCKSNRNGLIFKCKVCGYCNNSDRIGAMNIALRSLLQRQVDGERAMCQLAYSNHS